MQPSNKVSSLVCAAAFTALAGCGGGGDDPSVVETQSVDAVEEMADVAAEKAVGPVVSSVSQSGANLSVSGSNFGSAKVAPLLWDDFEGGANGARIGSAPKIGSWTPVSAAQTTYTSAQFYSGSKSLYGRRTSTNTSANFTVAMPDRPKFYKSFWFRFNSPSGTSGQTLLSQIHGTYGVGENNPGFMTGGLVDDWWVGYFALENSGYVKQKNLIAGQPSKNAWHHFEAVLLQSTPNTANGSVTIKIDGKVVYQETAIKTRERSGQRWDLATFFTGMPRFGATTETWIDDVYLSDSWARVELCETSVYASCTKKQIQPINSWNASAISVKFNKGAFSTGQAAYLFVVDANGAVNPQGFPVKIGSATTPPPEPTPTPAPTPTPEPSPPPTSSGNAPFVTSAVRNGTMVSIGGSNFGTGKVAPLVWDDFEGGANGMVLAAKPKAGSWQLNTGAAAAKYSTSDKHSGTKSAYGARSPGAQWSNFNVVMPDRGKFYKSFWFRYNYPVGTKGQTKISQIHGTYGVGDYNPGVMTGGLAGDWWVTALSLENSGIGYMQRSWSSEPSHNTWHHFEAVLKQSDPNVANGSVTIKIGGVTKYSQQRVKTRERTGERWNLATFFTGMTNFGANTETWIDDAYMNDTWARVEMCESPVYSSCTRKEIQPLSSWGANSITIQLNKGGFKAGETGYLFVIDADGMVNAQGYPLAIN